MIAIVLAVAATATDKVDLRPEADFVVSGIALLGAAVPQLMQTQLTPAHCRWCDGPDNTGLPGTGSQGTLNGVDAWFHDAMTGWLVSRGTANTLSDVVGYVLVPAGAFVGAYTATGPYATTNAGWRAMAIVGESTLVSIALMQGLKFTTVRKRPFVRYGTGDTSGGTYDVDAPDSRLSFGSGHTAIAAGLTFSVATTATIQESEAAPWLWGAAAVSTVSVAALRMMAEKHYFTDVLMGAAVGAGCGVVIPLLHKRGGPLSSDTVSVTAQGAAFAVSGRF